MMDEWGTDIPLKYNYTKNDTWIRQKAVDDHRKWGTRDLIFLERPQIASQEGIFCFGPWAMTEYEPGQAL